VSDLAASTGGDEHRPDGPSGTDHGDQYPLGQAGKANANSSSESGDVPVLSAHRVSKRYGQIVALRDVSFAVHRGEVVALVGDNGAGKSTLVNILSGALAPSMGSLVLDGKPVSFRDANQARRAGIETVYQDLALANDVAAWANLYLGREITRRGLLGALGWLDKGAMIRGADQAMDATRIRIKSVSSKCGALSGGQRQAVSVARAITWGSRLLLMDEPTAALGVEQQQQVGNLIMAVRETGTPVILISHNLPQVMNISNRILVLFQGRLIKELLTPDTSTEEVVMWITGAGLQKAAAS
jgi:simple sugar transport system ATP-binding protein